MKGAVAGMAEGIGWLPEGCPRGRGERAHSQYVDAWNHSRDVVWCLSVHLRQGDGVLLGWGCVPMVVPLALSGSQGRLDLFFLFMMVLMVVNTAAFVMVAIRCGRAAEG